MNQGEIKTILYKKNRGYGCTQEECNAIKDYVKNHLIEVGTDDVRVNEEIQFTFPIEYAAAVCDYVDTPDDIVTLQENERYLYNFCKRLYEEVLPVWDTFEMLVSKEIEEELKLIVNQGPDPRIPKYA